MDRIKDGFTRRRMLETTAAAGAATGVAIYAPAVIGQAKGPFDGETINVSSFSGPYPKMLASYIPEFTELTGRVPRRPQQDASGV